MATHATSKELRNMPLADLRKEAQSKRASIAKMKLGIEMQSHKDTGHFRYEKRELARILTILGEKQKAEQSGETVLKPKRKTSKVSAPARRSS